MEFSQPKSSLPYIKKLIAIAAPYATYWHQWIDSGASFLSDTEVKIFTNFLRYGTHDQSCKEENISSQVAEYTLAVTVKKLSERQHEFQEWKKLYTMEQSGDLRYASEKDRFLHSQITFLPLPADLKIVLAYFPEKTMAALLQKHSEQNLRNYWFMNTKSLALLKYVLKANNCLDLLR